MFYQRIKYFLKVTETGSFTKAAPLLYISPQGLAGQITQLEKDLGGKLFERTSLGVTLTDLGMVAKDHFTNATTVMEDSIQQVKDFANINRKLIHVCFFNALSREEIISPVISFLHSHYPELEINVELVGLSDGLNAFLSGSIDLFFSNIFFDNILDSWDTYSFASGLPKIAVSKNHPWSSMDKITYEDMKNCTLIKQRILDGQWDQISKNRFYAEIPCRNSICVANFYTLLEVLKVGDVFSVFPSFSLNDQLSQFKIFDYPAQCPVVHTALIVDSSNTNPYVHIIKDAIVSNFNLEPIHS